jgi:NAD(P)-dependent dehydrogenase (short-subunit alcohol dehydrogenase family)
MGNALQDKVIIITGAGRGIGREMALLAASEGAKIVVNDPGGAADGSGSNAAPAEEVVEEIKKRGGTAVANFETVAEAIPASKIVQMAIDKFGRLDGVVNNAGILRDAMLFKTTEDDFDSVIRVHLKGTFCVTHHAANYWRDQSKSGNQPRASVINTVSSAGLQGNVGQTSYGAAKAGIAAMTIIHSLELGRLGVRVNAIAPGGMTRMVGTIRPDAPAPKHPEEYTEFDPMNPGNSAPMVVWLASDEAQHVTGQVFRAVGNTITHYQPWALGDSITSKNKEQWDPTEIGNAINAAVFHSRHPGLQMGG